MIPFSELPVAPLQAGHIAKPVSTAPPNADETETFLEALTDLQAREGENAKAEPETTKVEARENASEQDKNGVPIADFAVSDGVDQAGSKNQLPPNSGDDRWSQVATREGAPVTEAGVGETGAVTAEAEFPTGEVQQVSGATYVRDMANAEIAVGSGDAFNRRDHQGVQLGGNAAAGFVAAKRPEPVEIGVSDSVKISAPSTHPSPGLGEPVSVDGSRDARDQRGISDWHSERPDLRRVGDKRGTVQQMTQGMETPRNAELKSGPIAAVPSTPGQLTQSLPNRGQSVSGEPAIQAASRNSAGAGSDSSMIVDHPTTWQPVAPKSNEGLVRPVNVGLQSKPNQAGDTIDIKAVGKGFVASSWPSQERTEHTVISTAMVSAQSSQTPQVTPLSSVPGSMPSKLEAITVGLVQADGSVEVTLKPEELGRLTLKLEIVGSATQVLITADRPDTQDLIRRHLDLLQNQLRDMGYDNPQFAFEQRHPTGDDDSPQRKDGGEATIAPTEARHLSATLAQTGLDMKV